MGVALKIQNGSLRVVGEYYLVRFVSFATSLTGVMPRANQRISGYSIPLFFPRMSLPGGGVGAKAPFKVSKTSVGSFGSSADASAVVRVSGWRAGIVSDGKRLDDARGLEWI